MPEGNRHLCCQEEQDGDRGSEQLSHDGDELPAALPYPHCKGGGWEQQQCNSETIPSSQAQTQSFTLQNSRKISQEAHFLPPHPEMHFIPFQANSLLPWGWGLSV